MRARILDDDSRCPAVRKIADMPAKLPGYPNANPGATGRPDIAKLSEPCRFCAARNHCDLTRLMAMLPEPAMATQLSLRSYCRGESLFCEGDRLGSVYFIRTGAVKTCLGNQAGDEQITGFHLSGDQLGLNALFGPGRHASTAIALENTDVCVVSVAHIEWLVAHVAGSLRWLMEFAGNCTDSSHQLFVMINKMDSETRLSRFLLDFSGRMQERGCPANEFTLPMSRKDIGNHLGMAVETVSRLMTRFQREGRLELSERRRVTLNDARCLKLR